MLVSVWTLDGKVFVKTSPGGTPIRIFDFNDLECLWFELSENFSYALNQPARHKYFHLAFLLSTGKGFTGYWKKVLLESILFCSVLFAVFFVFVSSNFIAISVIFVARVNLDNYNNHLLYTVLWAVTIVVKFCHLMSGELGKQPKGEASFLI